MIQGVIFTIRGLRFILLLALLQLSADSCNESDPGCTDPQASNYDPSAISNDGSCMYKPVSVSPATTVPLEDRFSGNSGLILWDGYLWTHNDDGPSEIYGLDTTDGKLMATLSLGGGENMNWEEITQDREDIFVGAFGNNASGNRTDLHILRVGKEALKAGDPAVDTIRFSYEDQVDLSPAAPNQTDFDCEAFLVAGDSIYLFTKQWISAQTSLYRLPKTPGTHVAVKVTTYPVDGMITGATWLESDNLVVLCGYNLLLQPFLYLLYDFEGTRFFSGNRRRVGLSLPFHQVEGIATSDGLKYYVSNESFMKPPFANSPQKLHTFDLSALLGGYLATRPL
jgi:hypothetical protein